MQEEKMLSGTKRARPTSRDEILDAFTSLVAQYGYEGTSLSAIAEKTGISSKGTIVHHFGNKHRMLELSHSQYIARRAAEAQALSEALQNPPDLLASYIYALLKAHRDDRAATVAFLREFTRYANDPEMKTLRQQRRKYRNFMINCIEAGIDEGVFRAVDAKMTCLHIFGACNYIWTWYDVNGETTIEDIASNFARTIIFGLLKKKPRKPDMYSAEWMRSLGNYMQPSKAESKA